MDIQNTVHVNSAFTYAQKKAISKYSKKRVSKKKLFFTVLLCVL